MTPTNPLSLTKAFSFCYEHVQKLVGASLSFGETPEERPP
jgi:hypothetical protein